MPAGVRDTAEVKAPALMAPKTHYWNFQTNIECTFMNESLFIDPIVVFDFGIVWDSDVQWWFATFGVRITEPSHQSVFVRCCDKHTSKCWPNILWSSRHVGYFRSTRRYRLESGRQRLPLNLPLGNYKCTAGVRFFDQSEGPTTEVDEFNTFFCKYYRYNVTLHCF